MLRFFILFLCAYCTMRGQTVEQLRAHIVEMEGYSEYPYRVRGKLHIGIGHKIQPGELLYVKMPRSVIESTFLRDLDKAKWAAIEYVPSFYSQPIDIRIMLVALAYNNGAAGFEAFYLFRNAIDKRNYREAARQLRLSKWARQLPGRANIYIDILNQL